MKKDLLNKLMGKKQPAEVKDKKCLICGSEFANYFPAGFHSELFEKHHVIGGGYRENCICPSCGRMDRERWLHYVIDNKTNIGEASGRILHFAPEQTIIDYIKQNDKIDYYTCDITPGRAMHIVDITDIQFRDETFDFIICNHVLEHIPDEAKAVSELKRVLKKKGKLIFSFPICMDKKTEEDKSVTSKEERLRRYGQEDHVRLYGTDYLDRFKKYDLNIKVYSPQDEFSKEEITRYGLIPDDVLMIATKK